MKKIDDYQLVDHGIDHAQYFPGCGVAFTEYYEVYTGCGSNFAKAIEDVLDQIALDGDYNIDGLEAKIKEDYRLEKWPTEPNTDKYCEENEDCELYYYLSIRLKGAEEERGAV